MSSTFRMDDAWALEPFADGYAVLGVAFGALMWVYCTRAQVAVVLFGGTVS